MVWNTTQSALYKAEHCSERREPRSYERRTSRAGERRGGAPRRSSAPQRGKSLFDDGDTLLLMVLLYILVREKSDQTLILSLLIAMLM